jgi:TP901 family phage tail tape measure protein
VSQNVEVIMTADTRQLLAEFDKDMKKIDEVIAKSKALGNEVEKSTTKAEKMGDRTKRSADTAGDGVKQLIGRVGGLAAGWISVGSALNFVKAANQQAIKDMEDAATKHDDLQRKFRVTAGLRGLQAEAAQKSITTIATKNAVDAAQAYDAGTAMVSTGFSATEASGGSLHELLRFHAAMAASGKDVNYDTTAASISGYMESQGMTKTAGNVQKLGKFLFAMREGNLQIEDLPFLAKEGAALATGINPQEQLAGFTSLLDLKMNPESAATGMRNVVSRLQTAGGQSEKVAALESLGLKPEQVDFVGEDLNQVLATLAKATAAVPENTRNIALDKIVGDQARGALLALMSADQSGKFDKYVALTGQNNGYDDAITEMQSGRNAGIQRLKTSSETMLAGMNDDGDVYANALQEQMLQQGYGSIPRYVAGGVFNTARLFGSTPQQALTAAAPTSFGGEMVDMEGRVRERILEVTQANTEALRENNELMRQQNAQAGMRAPAPPAPRPAQARSR